jgi:hypothetical protein
MDFEKSILSGIQHHHLRYHQQPRPHMGKLKLLAHQFITPHCRLPQAIQILPGILSTHTISINLPRIPLPITKTRHHITHTRINHKLTLMAKEVISRIRHRRPRKATMGSRNTNSKDQVIPQDLLLRGIINQVDIKTRQIIMFTSMPGVRFMPLAQTRRGLESEYCLIPGLKFRY